jgi:hypothetical protein
VQVVQGGNLKKGSIKDPSKPSRHGVGSLGTGEFEFSEQSFITWGNMLRRVYSPKSGAEFEAYKGCSVDDEWLLFSNFRKWFESQIYEKGYHLDKDLICKNNKVYSASTCVFIPQEINKFLTRRTNKRGECPIGVSYKTSNMKYDAKISINSKSKYLGLFDTPDEAFQAYKIAKENEAKRLAEFWRGRVDGKVVDALLNFTVDIAD